MITTYIFMQYFPELAEGNLLIRWLYSLHPLAVFLYIGIALGVTAIFYRVCCHYRLKTEARVTILVSAFAFFSAGLMNIVSMVV